MNVSLATRQDVMPELRHLLHGVFFLYPLLPSHKNKLKVIVTTSLFWMSPGFCFCEFVCILLSVLFCFVLILRGKVVFTGIFQQINCNMGEGRWLPTLYCWMSPLPCYCFKALKHKNTFLWVKMTFKIQDKADFCLTVIFWIINFTRDIPIHNFIKFQSIITLNAVFLNMMGCMLNWHNSM